jgi:tripartite-type tricarboxylate transporter receptor subunit TctC
MRNRREVLSLMTAATALPVVGIGGAARAQQPLELATFVVGFPAGGATDTVARLVAEAVSGSYAAASSTRAGSRGRMGSRFAGDLKRFRRVKIKP